jgi:REP element-mobilizing transposase RayT
MTASNEALYRRNLPHLRLTGAVYFVTWRLRPRLPELAPPERGRVMAALRHFDGERYQLDAFVVMNGHVHVLVKPDGGVPLQTIVHSWKSFTAKDIQRHRGHHGPLWQDEYFDRIPRDDREYAEKRDYILNNAFRRWPGLDRYDWAWALGLEQP